MCVVLYRGVTRLKTPKNKKASYLSEREAVSNFLISVDMGKRLEISPVFADFRAFTGIFAAFLAFIGLFSYLSIQLILRLNLSNSSDKL